MTKNVGWNCDGCSRPLEPAREFVELVDGTEVGRYHFCEDDEGHWETCLEKYAHNRKFSRQIAAHGQAFLARQSLKES